MDEYNLVDRLGELPRDILVHIFSLLPLQEAAATSILSKQLRYEWSFTTNLYFDVDDTLLGFRARKQEIKDQECRKYVNWVNHVVKQHRGPNIEQFRVCFDLDCRFTSSIDEWIQFATEKRVQVLVLDFLIHVPCASRVPYTFPSRLLGLEIGLPSTTFYGDIASLPSCGYSFEFLRILHLANVDVTQEVLEYFLSNCPVLERLSVYFASSLINLRVVHPPVSLKYLSIIECLRLKSIEICDANLVSFHFKGLPINLLLNNLPSLIDVSISGWRTMSFEFTSLPLTQLSCCLSQLETLMLDITETHHYVFPVPILAKLKYLELIVRVNFRWAIHQLTSFLKASPYLQRLVLKMDKASFMKMQIEKGVKCPHQNLKIVEISGYRGYENSVAHVVYLIENAVALEKLVIDPIKYWIYNRTFGANKIISQNVKEEEEARDHAMHQLKQIVPSTVEFVCL